MIGWLFYLHEFISAWQQRLFLNNFIVLPHAYNKFMPKAWCCVLLYFLSHKIVNSEKKMFSIHSFTLRHKNIACFRFCACCPTSYVVWSRDKKYRKPCCDIFILKGLNMSLSFDFGKGILSLVFDYLLLNVMNNWNACNISYLILQSM